MLSGQLLWWGQLCNMGSAAVCCRVAGRGTFSEQRKLDMETFGGTGVARPFAGRGRRGVSHASAASVETAVLCRHPASKATGTCLGQHPMHSMPMCDVPLAGSLPALQPLSLTDCHVCSVEEALAEKAGAGAAKAGAAEGGEGAILDAETAWPLWPAPTACKSTQ